MLIFIIKFKKKSHKMTSSFVNLSSANVDSTGISSFESNICRDSTFISLSLNVVAKVEVQVVVYV